MINMTINGVRVQVEEVSTLLEACRFYGLEIPTLCYNEGLSPYGACRLCIVEIGVDENSKLVTSCTYKAEEGLIVRSNSERVARARKMIIELLLSSCPSSKTIQDLAAKYGVRQARFKVEHEDCILCGLCVRMCAEQMDAKAIGFVNRGDKRAITTPFNMRSEVCRTCGACIWICPACQARCQGPDAENVICGSCMNIEYPCLDYFNDAMCYMDPCVACELNAPRKKKSEKKDKKIKSVKKKKNAKK